MCLPTTNLWYQTAALRKAFQIKSWFINLPHAKTTILYLRAPCLDKEVQSSLNAAIFRSVVGNTLLPPQVYYSHLQRWLSALEFAGFGKLCSQAYKHRGKLIRSLNTNFKATPFIDQTHRYPSKCVLCMANYSCDFLYYTQDKHSRVGMTEQSSGCWDEYIFWSLTWRQIWLLHCCYM